MATVFYDGMPNVNEKLNELYTAFAAGPYNALPLTGGNLTGPVTSTSTFSATTISANKIRAGFNGADVAQSVIGRIGAVQGDMLLSLPACGDFYLGSSGPGSSLGTALNLVRNTVTSRSINAAGTINASGADYAEYLIKRLDCGLVAAGDIVGIDVDGKITDQWSYAVGFAIKSTNPSLVGGDTWWQYLGPRPEVPNREPEYTDEQWDQVQAVYRAASLAYAEALEVARGKADRIAFCGQVPVNLLGGEPGQYLLPAQDGTGISGVFMDEADLTIAQYIGALGKVIAVEADGRARIIVKVV